MAESTETRRDGREAAGPRCFAIVGPFQSGKTSLLETLLERTGAVQRAGNRIPNYRETQNYVKTVMQLYTMLKPATASTAGGRLPARVRMEMPAPMPSTGRRNLPAPPSLPRATAAAAPGETLTVQD